MFVPNQFVFDLRSHEFGRDEELIPAERIFVSLQDIFFARKEIGDRLMRKAQPIAGFVERLPAVGFDSEDPLYCDGCLPQKLTGCFAKGVLRGIVAKEQIVTPDFQGFLIGLVLTEAREDAFA